MMSVNSVNSSMDSTLKCSTSQCVDDDDTNRLRCESCGRKVHYRCTLLPTYQIQVLKKRTMKFVCINCVNVSKQLQEVIDTQDVPFSIVSRDKEEIKKLRKELSACENLLKVQYENQKILQENIKTLEVKVFKIVTESTNEVISKKSSELEEKIEEILLKKTEEISKMIESGKKSSSYADVVNKPPNFREVMQIAKVEELAEERKKKLCAANIIVHGVSEDNEANNWLNEFKKDLDINYETKFVGRIGAMKPQTKRPIKIQLNREDDKLAIFKNLKNLKGKEEYKGISVTEDFTAAERNVIKAWVQKAKERNEKEGLNGNFVWKVRGNPKKGTLHLKKININQNSTQ